jgi:hypothetical protein
LARNGFLDLQVTHSTVIIAASDKIVTRPGEDFKFILKLMKVVLEESEETDRVRSGSIDQRESL